MCHCPKQAVSQCVVMFAARLARNARRRNCRLRLRLRHTLQISPHGWLWLEEVMALVLQHIELLSTLHTSGGRRNDGAQDWLGVRPEMAT